MGYVTESINTLFPICDVINTFSDAIGFSSLVSASHAFTKEPLFGLTWGGVLLSIIPVNWFAKVDVQCHAALSMCIQSIANQQEATVEHKKAEQLPSGSYYKDNPNDLIIENITNEEGGSLRITYSQFSLAKWHFLKDTIEKMNPPLMAIKILLNLLTLLPYLDSLNKWLDDQSNPAAAAASISAKILLYGFLGYFAARGSRLEFQNTLDSFEHANQGRELVRKEIELELGIEASKGMLRC